MKKSKKKPLTDKYADNRGDATAREDELEEERSDVERSAIIGIDNLGDPVNSMTGELQTRVQQNIPMRPLVIISNNNNQNYNMNVSQSVPCNE